ncbi:hypothetical protein CRUP_015791, partial [Coryphaenoides rupestris]
MPVMHQLDRQRLGVQADRPRRGSPAVGSPEEQAQDELREAEPRPALLLRQKHNPQDGGQAIRLLLHLRPAGAAGIRA